MKSIRVERFGGPEVLKLVESADPKPGPGQVVVAVKAIGVNPVETYVRAGKYGPMVFPFTPGSDAAGVVVAVGDGVTRVGIDEKVYVIKGVDGSYTDMMLCAAESVFSLPPRLSMEQGAGVGVPFGTAYRALHIRGAVRPNKWVMVHGASGGVGTAAVQLAVMHGCRVIGTAGSEKGMDLVRQQGAVAVFNHHDAGYLDRIKKTAGGGVNLIIEFVAGKNLNNDLGLLAKRGRVVVVGSQSPIEIDPRQTMVADADIRGMSLMHSDQAELAMIHAALAAGFHAGNLSPVIGRTFTLEQASFAHEAVTKGGANGKVILTVG